MNVTDILKVFPEVLDGGKGYHMIDDGGVEVEVGEYLWGLVRLLKPTHVLTTGIYTGVSDSYIGLALKENGYGTTDAIEYEEKHITRAKELFIKLGIEYCVTTHLMSSLDFQPSHTYKLMFLDTEPAIRFAELIRFFPYLEEGGFVFIHDCPRSMTQGNINTDHPEVESWPFGNLPNEIIQWERTGELKRVHFPNPRGMCGWYKSHRDDYKI